MKTKIKIRLLVFLLSFISAYNCYAQYTPGEKLPWVNDDKCDIQESQRGFIRYFGKNTALPIDERFYSLRTLASSPKSPEVFRLSANGTLSLMANWDSYPTINLYTNNRYWLASMSTPGEEFTITAYRTINFSPRSSGTTMRLEDYGTFLTKPLIFSGNSLYDVALKIGKERLNDPTINNSSDRWLRIGGRVGIAFWGGAGVNTNDNPHFYLDSTRTTSNVPIRVNTPNNISLTLDYTYEDNQGWIGSVTNKGVYLGANQQRSMYLRSDGKVYVGINSTDANSIRQELRDKFNLFVAKGILSEDYNIAPKTTWSDFVFDSNYQLRSLKDVSTFIEENKHLPDVPSAQVVSEEGYSQHEMNKILLQKIEELTLYTIQQQKEIEILKSKNKKK